MIITEYHNPTLVQTIQAGDLLRIIVDTPNEGLSETKFLIQREAFDSENEEEIELPVAPETTRGEYFVDASIYSNSNVAWTEDDNGDVWMYLSSYAEWTESSRASLDECPALNPGGGFTDTLPPGFPLPPWKDYA